MSRVEYVNVSGLRVDGRRPREIRRFRASMGLFPRADGSALVQQGGTKVIAIVHGPRDGGSGGGGMGDVADVSCDYIVAPFATAERRRRRGPSGGTGDRRAVEAATTLRRCFESIVEGRLYPRSTISLQCYVVASDGGAVAAAINAGTLALIDAGIAVRDYVCACSLVVVQRVSLLDPCFIEEASGGPQLLLAQLPRSSAVVACTMEARLPLERYDEVLRLAGAGCESLYDLMRGRVREHAAARLRARAALSAPVDLAAVAAAAGRGSDDGGDGEGQGGVSGAAAPPAAAAAR